MVNKLIYLGYYVLNTPWPDFFRNIRFIKKEKKVSGLYLYKDIILSTFRYDISIMDYFSLRLFNKNDTERKEYAGVGFMYRYQLLMNPHPHRQLLENKVKFHEHFHQLSGRRWSTYDNLNRSKELIEGFLKNNTGKIVLKYSKGQSGREVKVLPTQDITPREILAYMKEKKFDLVEEFVVQHDMLMKIAPRGLNTVRIITQYHHGEVKIIGTSLRLSVNKEVDNLTSGGLVVEIDEASGMTRGVARYIDPTKTDEVFHPVTNEKVSGFQLPYWRECIDLVRNAALLTPENRSVGWDVAITNTGPLLIEGNHNWNNTLWQLPLQKGMKPLLLSYLDKS